MEMAVWGGFETRGFDRSVWGYDREVLMLKALTVTTEMMTAFSKGKAMVY